MPRASSSAIRQPGVHAPWSLGFRCLVCLQALIRHRHAVKSIRRVRGGPPLGLLEGFVETSRPVLIAGDREPVRTHGLLSPNGDADGCGMRCGSVHGHAPKLTTPSMARNFPGSRGLRPPPNPSFPSKWRLPQIPIRPTALPQREAPVCGRDGPLNFGRTSSKAVGLAVDHSEPRMAVQSPT